MTVPGLMGIATNWMLILLLIPLCCHPIELSPDCIFQRNIPQLFKLRPMDKSALTLAFPGSLSTVLPAVRVLYEDQRPAESLPLYSRVSCLLCFSD